MAPSRLLYFTEHGLYLQVGKDREFRVFGKVPREATLENETFGETDDLRMIMNYTSRELSHASDRLRGIMDVLRVLYRDRTYHGIPTDDLDVAIAWTPLSVL
jgi:hypothetical protein